MKKKDAITRILQNLLEYGKRQNVPLMSELEHKLNTTPVELIVALFHRFIVPAEDVLEDYLVREFETLRLTHPTPELQDYELPDEVKHNVVNACKKVLYVIRL